MMEYILSLQHILPFRVSLLSGMAGFVCFVIALTNKENKKISLRFQIVASVGALGFLPVFIKYFSEFGKFSG